MTVVQKEDNGVVEIQRLAGWMSLHEAGVFLGIESKQGMHRIVWDACEFDFDKDVRSVGERPIYVIRESAVKALKKRREKAAAARAARRAEIDRAAQARQPRKRAARTRAAA